MSFEVELGLASYSLHCHLGKHPDCAWESPYDAFWLVQQAKEAGFAGLQLSPLHYKATLKEVQALGVAAAEAGLFLELGAGPVGKASLARLLELASLANAQVVRAKLGIDRSKPVQPQLEALVPLLKHLAKVAVQCNVYLALENHQDITSAELARLVEEVDNPYVGVCLDFGNGVPLGEAPETMVLTLAPYAFSCHLKDCLVPGGESKAQRGRVALGEGDLDLPYLLERLIETSRLERVLLEVPYAPAPGDTLEAILAGEADQLQRSLDYARRRLKLG